MLLGEFFKHFEHNVVPFIILSAVSNEDILCHFLILIVSNSSQKMKNGATC